MLYDVYEEVRASQHLSDLPPELHSWGELADLPVSAAPRICWIPTEDDFAAPLPVAVPFVTGGRRVEVEAVLTRWAGVEVEIYVPAGPQGPRVQAELIRRFWLALLDATKSLANLRGYRGRHRGRAAVSTQTLCYVLSLQVGVPIYDLIPAQICGGVEVRLARE